MNQKQRQEKKIFDFEIDTKHMLVRPRVARLIQAGISKPLALLHAPSGYGKTTAAVQFIRECAHTAVYLTLTALDRDTKHLWSRLCSLYARLDMHVGEEMLRLGFPATNANVQHFTNILTELLSADKHILVLDDYQTADSPELSEFIEKLASLRMQNLCILLVSRKLPRFYGIEMKVKGLLYEIDREQLRFDVSEIIGYYERDNKKIEEGLAQKISQYTEGWASAIYLSRSYASSMTGRMPAIPDFDIDRMIEHTIYDGYSAEAKEFLLRLCILDQFDLEFAAYVTQSKNAYDLLARITSDNSLLKVSEDKRFFSMHSLLREFLHKKLASSDDTKIRELHARAGEYYAYRDDILPALFHFDQAQDYAKTARVILESKYMRIFANQEFSTVIAYMTRMPAEIFEQHPMLWLILIHAYTYTHQVPKAMELLAKVSALCESPAMPRAQRNELLGESLMIRAMLSFNDYRAMLACCREAIKLIPNGTSLVSPRGSYTFGNPSILYAFHNRLGGLDDAVRAFVEEFCVWEKMSDLGYGADFLMKAEAAFERCDYEAAESDGYRAINKALNKKQTSIVVAGKMLIVKICAARGKYSAAVTAFRELCGQIDQDDLSVYRITLDLCQAAYSLLWGNVEDVPQWLQRGEFVSEGMSRMAAGMEHLAHAHVLLFKKDYLRLESVVPAMLELYGIFHNQYGVIRANLAGAIAAYHLYSLDAALPFMREALAISEADRLVMPYLEYGEFLLPLLKELAAQCESMDIPAPKKTLEDLLRRIHDYTAALQKARTGYLADHPTEATASGAKLTKRETEILGLIVQGLNGEEIAARLFVTPINVRVITSKIYRKLGVKSRAEAVRVALDNQLIK